MSWVAATVSTCVELQTLQRASSTVLAASQPSLQADAVEDNHFVLCPALSQSTLI